MDQSLDIDLKEVTFSKYFNKNNASHLNSSDRSHQEIQASTPQKYSQLQLSVNEARFINATPLQMTLTSFVSVAYGNHKYETHRAPNEKMNPKWNQIFYVPLHYQGQLLFPETIEIAVNTSNKLYNVSMGKSVLSFREILAEQNQINDWFCLVDLKQITGSIHLSFQFLKANNKSVNLDQATSQYNDLKLQKHFYSCYEQPINRVKQIQQGDQQSLDLKQIQKLELNQQIPFLENILHNFKLQNSPRKQSPFKRPHHQNGSAQVFKNYFQKQGQNQSSNYSHYFTEYDFSNNNNYQKKSQISTHNNNIQKLLTLIDDLKNLAKKKEEETIYFQKLDKQNIQNNYEINELDTIMTDQKFEIEQLNVKQQLLKDEIQINRNLTQSLQNLKNSSIHVLNQKYEKIQNQTDALQQQLIIKIETEKNNEKQLILQKARSNYNLDDFTNDFYMQVKVLKNNL